MQWHREKVLNTLTEIYLILRTKVFVGNDSFRCDFGPVLHTKQRVFKSWRFCGPLLWILIFSSFHSLYIGFKSDDWLGFSSSFIFFLWNQLRVSLSLCLESLSCWNVHPRFIFSIPVNCLSTFFHSSFLQLYEVCQYRLLKNIPHHDVPTSKLHCWYGVFGVMCSAICPLKMVCITASKEYIYLFFMFV